MDREFLDEVIENDFVVQPYMFEPLPDNTSDNNNSNSESDTDGDSDNGFGNDGERFGNVDWCRCGHCRPMPTERESKCCHEYNELEERLQVVPQCVTQHRGFDGNCLNEEVIEVSFYKFLRDMGPIGDEEPMHQVYRYIAYRRMARWVWKGLAKLDRRVLPACAVSVIRENFQQKMESIQDLSMQIGTPYDQTAKCAF